MERLKINYDKTQSKSMVKIYKNQACTSPCAAPSSVSFSTSQSSFHSPTLTLSHIISYHPSTSKTLPATSSLSIVKDNFSSCLSFPLNL